MPCRKPLDMSPWLSAITTKRSNISPSLSVFSVVEDSTSKDRYGNDKRWILKAESYATST